MKRILIALLMTIQSCGSNSGDDGTPSIALTKENLAGHWRLIKIKVSGKEYALKGAAITQYKTDGTFVSAGQEYYTEGNQAAACWYANTGKYELKDTVSTETIEKETGAKACVGGDFNPIPYTSSLTATTLTSKKSDGTEFYFEKDTTRKDFDYQTFAEKFEKVELTVGDADKPSGFSMTYRNPRQAGYTRLCPRFSGSQSSGFTIVATFTYNNSVYDLMNQWDEGALTAENYNGSSPLFQFDKRTSTSTDSGGNTGTGRYACSSVADCASQCSLKISSYSLSKSAGVFEVSCSNLAADSASDNDNLFGAALTDFVFKASCSYNPDLGL